MYEKQYNELKTQMETHIKELKNNKRKSSALKQSLSMNPDLAKSSEQMNLISSQKKYYEDLYKSEKDHNLKLQQLLEDNKIHYEKQLEEMSQKAAENSVIAATIAFEKDQHIVKLNKMIKKLTNRK